MLTAASPSAQLGRAAPPHPRSPSVMDPEICRLLHLGLGWGPRRAALPRAPKRTVCLGRMSFRTQGTCQEGQQQGHLPAARLARPGRQPEQVPGPRGARVRPLGNLSPRGPPSGGGLRLTLLGLWASVCPSAGLEGAREAWDRVQPRPPWAPAPLTVGCWPGRRGRGECLAARSLLPEAAGTRDGPARQSSCPQLRTAQQAAVYLYDTVYLFIGLLLGGAQTRTRNSRPGRRGGWVLSP